MLPVPPPPGRLPQTQASPSARTRDFAAEMTDLWAAVVTGKAALAAQAFFPLPAYAQIKAIYDPAADWHGRLFADFSLDVAAAHRYLEPGAAHARLVRVIVPSAEAAWIPPGVCSNSGGYWHVGGARLVYRQQRPASLDRHRLADLLAGPVVRGPFRRRAARRGHRDRGHARGRARGAGAAGRVLIPGAAAAVW